MCQAIGVVVSGFTVVESKTGVQREKLCGNATCFAVSPTGHLLTAKRLVEEYDGLAKDATATEHARTKGFEIKPHLWVYCASEKYDASVAYMSPKYDFAVLKTDRRGPYFRLASEIDRIKGTRIHAFGYPEAPSRPLSIEVATETPPTETGASVTIEMVSSYEWCTGQVSGLRTNSGTVYLEHNAPIKTINAGGPVVTDDGIVVGMTAPTPSNNEKDQAAGKQSYALNFCQAREELTSLIPEVMRVVPRR